MDLLWRTLFYFILYCFRIFCRVPYMQVPHSFVPRLTLWKTLIRNLNMEGNKNNSIRRWITSSFYLTTRERAVADVTQRLHQCCFTQKAELAGFQTPWPEDIYVTLRRGCLLLVGRGFQVLFTQTLLKKKQKNKNTTNIFQIRKFPQRWLCFTVTSGSCKLFSNVLKWRIK